MTKRFLLLLLLLPGAIAAQSSGQPAWWYGGALGVNFNFYSSTITQLKDGLPTAGTFSKGSGSGLYLAPVLQYRPNAVWGGMLALGFDGRGGSFDDASGASLSTSMNYLSLEPSVRYSPFDLGLYFYAGPRIGFNIAKTFGYTPPGGTKTEGEWSGIRGAVLGGQLGAGFEFPLTSSGNDPQLRLAPFVAAQFGQGPRSEESWSLASVRTGFALMFGSTSFGIGGPGSGDVQFSVRAPRIIPNVRTVKETFPVRNYVFFDEQSSAIPARYITLSRAAAETFKEEQLLHPEPKDLTGRSRRQMTAYHNILNILGDRMRRFPRATVILLGASEQGPADGQALAEAVKGYLVSAFAIDAGRVTATGSSKPSVASSQTGGTRELELVRPEDRRVDIVSTTPELLDPVQIVSLQEDDLESDILVNVPGALESLSSWSITATDDRGAVKRFGPFTSDQERVSGRTILGDGRQGAFTLTLEGQAKDGGTVKREQTIRLQRSDEPEEAPGFRFSILFEFDQSKTVATYERFLTESVAPLIADGNAVIIHGHTDIIGEESHNLKLSRDRAQETMAVLERVLAKNGKRKVKFDTYGFGEDVRRAPFDNRLPEERFYNRTVIIDIVPE